MKTFEQYINEDLNFRLGGKENKGDYVKHLKFSELEKGDIIYQWCVDTDKNTVVMEFEFVFECIEGNKIISSKRNRVTKRITDKQPIQPPTLECSTFMYRSSYCWLYSTIHYSNIDVIKIAKECLEEIQGDSEAFKKGGCVYEAVDFRLGGKKRSGFDQTGPKKFNELEKGDAIYRIEGFIDNNSFRATKFTFDHWNDNAKWNCIVEDESGEKTSLIINKEERRFSTSINAEVTRNHFALLSTNNFTKDEIFSKYKELTKNDKSSRKILLEGVDFRLGGKDNKGVAAPKTFEDLEEGDLVYAYEVYNKLNTVKQIECEINNRSSSGTLYVEYKNDENELRESTLFLTNLVDEYTNVSIYKGMSIVYSSRELTEEQVYDYINKAKK